jgi:hypothetical protein
MRGRVTGLVRIFLLLGLLVLGVGVVLIWQDERATGLKKPTASPGEQQRVGRSALSHGGPGAGAPLGSQERSLNPVRSLPSEQTPESPTR